MTDTTPPSPPEPGEPPEKRDADAWSGQPPSVEGGLAAAAGDEGTSGISMSGVTPPAPNEAGGDTTSLDEIVEAASRSGWGRGRDVEPGDDLHYPQDDA